MQVANIGIENPSFLLGKLQKVSIKKTIIFEYFLVLFLVVLSARASFIAANRFFTILFFFINLFYFIKKKKTFGKFSLILVYYIFWVILIFIFFNLSIFSFRNIYTYGGFFVIVLGSFFLVSTVENIFYKFINIIYFLALISLIFYFFQLLFPEQFFRVNNFLSNTSDFFIRPTSDPSLYSNSIFFTFSKGTHLYRNSGFAWEPGAFGGFLLIALFIYLSTNNFKLGKKFWVFSIALITTFSTTAYIGLLFVFFYILYNLKDRKKSFWIFIIIIVLLVSLFYLPFVKEKIVHQITETIKTVKANSFEEVLNRFESFFYDLQLLKDNLFFMFFGRGIQAETRFVDEGFVHLSSGIGDYLLMFGFIGFILLAVNLHNSLKKIALLNNAKGYLIFFIVMIFILFSNPMVYTPLIFVFQYYYLVNQ